MARKQDQTRQQLRKALAANHQRFTRQRARVYEVLKATDQHPTAEEVYRKVRPAVPSVSLATVYKALDALVDCGLAQKLTFGDGSARFDPNVANHPHLRDSATGQLIDLPPALASGLGLAVTPELAQLIQQETGFLVTGLHVELLGRLRRSAAAPRALAAPVAMVAPAAPPA
jgi:Fur family transcriptional regulator, peroxide stress response regulator